MRIPMRVIDLDDGLILQEAIDQFYQHNNDTKFTRVLRILRDSMVYIPSNLKKEDWMELAVLSNDTQSFLCVFSTKEEMEKEYKDKESGRLHFMEAMFYANKDESIDGIIVDAFGKSIVVKKEAFEDVMAQLSIIDDDEYMDPVMMWLHLGTEAYNKNTADGFKEAESWYLKAASLFDGQAMCNLGYIYTYGRVGKPNKKLGWHYFKEAARQNNIDGLMKLADGFRSGEFMRKDDRAAFSIYLHLYEVMEENSMVEEYPEILLRLGECYFYGIGVKKDYPDSIHLLGYAASLFERKSKEIFYYGKLRDKAKTLLNKAMHFIDKEYVFKCMCEGSFRDFYLRIVYIETDSIEGTLCIGYVDHEKGICFRGVYRCLINDRKKEFFEKTDVVYTYEDVKDGYFLDMRQRIESEDMIEEIIKISKEYVGHSSLDMMRMAVIIDEFRHPIRPDEVLAGIVMNGVEIEKIWIRCESVEDGCMTGILLEEPKCDCQIHKGSEVSVLTRMDDETGIVEIITEVNTMVN